MKYKVYKVVAEHKVAKPDIDGIYYKDFEKFFEDMYSSRTSAIRKAQKLVSRHVCYVHVVRLFISEQGITYDKVIYVKH